MKPQLERAEIQPSIRRVKELVLQSLEHERGGVKVYEAALQCATNEELKEEWQNYLQQTRRHVQALTTVCSALELDSEEQTHLDWELLGEVAKELKGEQQEALRTAYEQIEDEEDEHLYHTRGWCRELWLKSLGLKSVLPPPEERRDVKTAIDAARAQHARTKMR
ncbi:MAG: hypothetical protein ACREVO_15250 [Steroidobacteraceae bacterium]